MTPVEPVPPLILYSSVNPDGAVTAGSDPPCHRSRNANITSSTAAPDGTVAARDVVLGKFPVFDDDGKATATSQPFPSVAIQTESRATE
jgi:hypothetical protein